MSTDKIHPMIYKLWGEGYELAVDVLTEAIKDLRRREVPPSWDLIEKLVEELGKKGRADLDPSNANSTAH